MFRKRWTLKAVILGMVILMIVSCQAPPKVFELYINGKEIVDDKSIIVNRNENITIDIKPLSEICYANLEIKDDKGNVKWSIDSKVTNIREMSDWKVATDYSPFNETGRYQLSITVLACFGKVYYENVSIEVE